MHDGLHCKLIERSGKKHLRLYSLAPRDYEIFEGLPAVDSSNAHLRRHPLSGEWIGLSSARQTRTFLPNAADCPFCPMQQGGALTDIPVDDYEVAIFSNRFAALTDAPADPPDLFIKTAPGAGLCEVISYSADHNASFSDIGAARIALLAAAIGSRAREMMEDGRIQYVLPFENRGRAVGATLDHPHGQMYALDHLTMRVKQMAQSFVAANPLANLIDQVPRAQIVAQNDTGIAFVPEWARYPFETWVVPHRRVDSPTGLASDELAEFGALLEAVAVKLDDVFDAPMPYTMSWQLAPRGYADCFHFHCLFQPVQRSRSKLKYLASVEQFTGFFLLDMAPEKAARILNGVEQPDD
jgi:UDPglucose--hexose-1-phosphate uridylyltransferase